MPGFVFRLLSPVFCLLSPLSMFRQKSAHFLFGAVEGDQKTGVFHSGDAADPAVAFDNFPFSAFDFDAQVIRRKQVKKHPLIANSHDLSNGRSIEFEDSAANSPDVRELFRNCIMLKAMLQEEPILQLARRRVDRLKFVAGQIGC